MMIINLVSWCLEITEKGLIQHFECHLFKISKMINFAKSFLSYSVTRQVTFKKDKN